MSEGGTWAVWMRYGGRPAGRARPPLLVRALATWLSNCLALLLACAVIPAMSYGGDAGTLLLAGLILGVVNLLVRPWVILFTLPAVILTFGLALLAINALMLWLTSEIVSGFSVGGFFSTLGGALIVWLVNLVLRRWRDGSTWVGGATAGRPAALRDAGGRAGRRPSRE
jgi:putative membrane protein